MLLHHILSPYIHYIWIICDCSVATYLLKLLIETIKYNWIEPVLRLTILKSEFIPHLIQLLIVDNWKQSIWWKIKEETQKQQQIRICQLQPR